MTKNIETRTYPMADAALGKISMDLGIAIKRDLPDFATRNFTNQNLVDFEKMAGDFNELPTDEELLGEQKDATDNKYKTMNDIKVAIRPIRNMAELVYKSAGKYTSFNFTDMDGMNDFELYKLANRVVRIGTKYLADLAVQGLTQAHLTSLHNLATLLFTQMSTAEEKIETRDLETQHRIQKGNELWEKVVELASIGKSLYVDTNEAKYNDYVLTSNTPPPPPPPENPTK